MPIRQLWKRNQLLIQGIRNGVGDEELAGRHGVSVEVVEELRKSKVLREYRESVEVLAGAGDETEVAASPSFV